MMPHGERVIDALARLHSQTHGRTVMAAAKREIYRSLLNGRATGCNTYDFGSIAAAENYFLGVLYGPNVFPWPKKKRAKPATPTLKELIAAGKREAAAKENNLCDTA